METMKTLVEQQGFKYFDEAGLLCDAQKERDRKQKNTRGKQATQAKTVTNISAALSRDSSSLTRCMISPVDLADIAWALNRLVVIAINSAAGTPLPDTSPTTKNSR